MSPTFQRIAFCALAVTLIAGGAVGVLVWTNESQRASDGPLHSQRIVSLNLCTDQLLLALADRDQIASVTVNAVDPNMSAEAELARGLPQSSGSAEGILQDSPTMLLGMPASGSSGAKLMERRGVQIVDVAPANSLEEIFAALRQVAKVVGHVGRGEAIISNMQRDMASLPQPKHRPVIAYYQRRGFLTGAGTLVDDLITRAGGVNLATRLGRAPLSQLSLENLVAAQPDFLILETASEKVADQGTEMLHHPAIVHIPRIYMPEALTVCGGPAYVKAARVVSEALNH